MSKSTLDSIASAKAKLAEELKKLEEEEASLLEEAATNAYQQVSDMLSRFGQHFNATQKADLVAKLGPSKEGLGRPKKTSGTKKQVAPKYWLPHTQETWTGRGRTPKAFAIWEGSASYKEWKAKHPNEKFPAFPG